MTINMFEGARRIAIFSAACWAIGVIFLYWTEPLIINATFAVSGPGREPVLISTDCTNDDANEWKTIELAEGQIWLHLCFQSFVANDGRNLIAFRRDPDGALWGNEKYSAEVMRYTQRTANNFMLTAADQTQLTGKTWGLRWEKFKRGALSMSGGLFALWIFSTVVGWVVRGFLGIPAGLDSKPRVPSP